MKKTLSLLIYSFVLAVCIGNIFAQTNEFEMLMQKIREDFKKNPSIDEELKTYDTTEGKFTDVDYSSIQRTNWPPLVHIERLYDFAFAYTNSENKYYKDEELYNKIVKGLEYWHERNPWCHNWWYNQIAEPQKLGVLLIQMRTGERKVPLELENKILERMRTDGGNPAKWTGANRTDIALHLIYRSCLKEDSESLDFAMDNVYNPIVYATKEGFQYDNSNFQHGQQLYIGGYGDEILKGVTQVAMYAHGTRFAIPKEKLDLISKFMRETYYPTIRGKHMLFDVMGRSVSRPGVPDKSHTALFAERMKILDPENAEEFQQIIDRLTGKEPAGYAVRSFHTHYFRGDYTLHVRPEYTFDVRMVSNRTIRCEYGNGENLKTYFMSDGCTNIVMRGDEYDGIFPVWNWARIPGVTAPQFKEIPKAKSDWQQLGTSTFAGGVSDSIYGVTAYSYSDSYKDINTSANKSWFFFDDEIVCLGAGINSEAPEKVFTTVNQSLLARESLIEGSAGKNTRWTIHDNVGYVFPNGGDVFILTDKQRGTWYEINNSINDKSIIEKDIFTIGFDHGLKPKDASYAYIVVPGMNDEKGIKKYINKGNIEIMENNSDIQAVCHKRLDVMGIVFYKAGVFSSKAVTVKADRPCAILLKGIKGKNPVMHIADPGQNSEVINISVSKDRRAKDMYNIVFTPDDNPVYAGATKVFTLN